MTTPESPRLEDYPFRTTDKLRYGDTDKLGHVNNAVFATFLETGRVDLLCDPERPVNDPGTAFVLARLVVDFRAEAHWPGSVDIGTRIQSIGRSSLRLQQAVFQNGACIASGETVLVQMDEATRKSRPFSKTARASLDQLPGQASDVSESRLVATGTDRTAS